jgi:hypothetical protein
MASRTKAKGEFVNPARVKDLNSWCLYYKGRFQNLKIDYATGNPIVLNPENLAEVVKVIEIPKGMDLYRALETYRSTERDKYTTALQQMMTINDQKSAEKAVNDENLQKAYFEVAQAISGYRQTPTPDGVKRVAIAQRDMASLEKEMNSSLERAVTAFAYSIPPAGDVPVPPAFQYVRYESLSNKRAFLL